MPNLVVRLGTTGTQFLSYRWNGFCTDFNHVEGSDTFSGQMWLREGVRLLDGTSAGTVPDFTMTVSGGSYDEALSFVSFGPVGQLQINEPNLTHSTHDGTVFQTFTADATALSATACTFTGTFGDPDTLSGECYLDGLVLYSGGHQDWGFDASGFFTWVRNLPACTPI
jgi:hypothetical protein